MAGPTLDITKDNYKAYVASLRKIHTGDKKGLLLDHVESALEQHFSSPGAPALQSKTANTTTAHYFNANDSFIRGEIPAVRTDIPGGQAGHLAESLNDFNRLHTLEHDVRHIENKVGKAFANEAQKEILKEYYDLNSKLSLRHERLSTFKPPVATPHVEPHVAGSTAAVVTAEAEHAAPGLIRRKLGGAIAGTVEGIPKVAKGLTMAVLVTAVAGAGLLALTSALKNPAPRRSYSDNGLDNDDLAFANTRDIAVGALAVPAAGQQQQMGSWISKLPTLEETTTMAQSIPQR